MQDSHAARRPVTTAPHPAAYPRHDLLAHPWPARPNSVPPQPLPQTQLYLSAKQSPPHVVFQKITLLQSQKHATKPTERYRPVAEEYSFLECVVELLKGTVVHRKKNVLQGVEARVWLRADMEALEYKLLKKGVVPRNHQIKLCNVRKVKGSEKDLQLDIVGEKRPIDFAFRTAKELNIWLSALCCLVPRQATVKKNHSRIENRWDYNPLQDTWNDKSVCQRKMVRELLILGTIGTGATAKVKAALSTTERRFYAVKVISKATIWKTRRMGSRFGRGMLGRAGDLTMDDLEEATVLKDLRHDNIVRLYAVFEDEDLEMFYYVTEYLPRGPVMRSHSVQTEKRLNEDTARSAFVDVVAGLEYLHRNNVVHRDIKPDNLLTSGDGTVKISDFGAAIMYIDEEEAEREEEGEGGREEEHAKGNGSGREREGNGRGTGKRARKSQNLNIGTPAFTAPELCISEHAPQCPERCFAADIWSLGATLFYFIYGRPPHLEKNVLNMYDVICTDDVTFPPEPVIGSNLKKLLQRTLARKPEERATIAQIVQSPWLTKDVHISEKLKEIKRRVERILV
ncbi:Serine/threonine protein kinase [Chondrus crispus]|uniref:Serine/threonine protein kinase n=1 Tax=Chondrus crispus TaxID=2769 RepID=R7QFC7_CHOCR|nr:Serine/threonine protein kinase [Chondrus crispus]CDF36458.1 Serine/threonine protein kinase [Chondrus crispus]|eukprot:XP_005716277.1 Serine/threonine protein kinase [Chondrus crispus]